MSQYDTILNGINLAKILQCGDLKTRNALVLFIQAINSRPKKIESVSIVRFEMSLQLFMTVLPIIISNNYLFYTIPQDFMKISHFCPPIDRLSRQHTRLLCYLAKCRELFAVKQIICTIHLPVFSSSSS